MSSNNLFFKKREKVVLAKSTAALTCLLGLLIISRASAQTSSATGSMAVSVVVLSGSDPTIMEIHHLLAQFQLAI